MVKKLPGAEFIAETKTPVAFVAFRNELYVGTDKGVFQLIAGKLHEVPYAIPPL